MKAKALLSSVGIAKASQERWQKANYRYNRMHFPISGAAIYHDVNGDKMLEVGKIYLLVNSSAVNLELIEGEEYYHMYVDFRTVPPLLNRDALEIDVANDYYLTYVIKALQSLAQENKKENNRSNIKQEQDEDEALPLGLCVLHEAADDLRVLHVAVKADGLLLILHGNVGHQEDHRQDAHDGADDEKRVKFTHGCLPPLDGYWHG